MAIVGSNTIKVEGLVELQRALRQADVGLPRRLRQANKAAAEVVAEEARRRTPVRTGRARKSIAVRAEQRGASVKGGGARVPYFGFLDYGNRPGAGGGVGRGDSHPRAFVGGGRIIYPALGAKSNEVTETFEREVDALLKDAGLPPRRIM